MSTNAAIAAVTATLTNMIQAAVSADATVGSGTVTARPPDRARQGAPVNQVNLFLYRRRSTRRGATRIRRRSVRASPGSRHCP